LNQKKGGLTFRKGEALESVQPEKEGALSQVGMRKGGRKRCVLGDSERKEKGTFFTLPFGSMTKEASCEKKKPTKKTHPP